VWDAIWLVRRDGEVCIVYQRSVHLLAIITARRIVIVIVMYKLALVSPHGMFETKYHCLTAPVVD
jgi:hypothetical protein